MADSKKVIYLNDKEIELELSQKTQIVGQYIIPAAIGYIILGVFLGTGALPNSDAILQKVGGLAAMTLLATLAQDLLPKPLKEAIIFTRVRDRLPGHRAFTPAFEAEDRYDVHRIPGYDTLKQMSPKHQQREFYKVYRKHAEDVRVKHYSHRYLAWRDTSAALLLLALVTVPVLDWIYDAMVSAQAHKLAGITFLGALLATTASRLNANELVKQVLTAEELRASGGDS
jgi:hypothetical protein